MNLKHALKLLRPHHPEPLISQLRKINPCLVGDFLHLAWAWPKHSGFHQFPVSMPILAKAPILKTRWLNSDGPSPEWLDPAYAYTAFSHNKGDYAHRCKQLLDWMMAYLEKPTVFRIKAQDIDRFHYEEAAIEKIGLIMLNGHVYAAKDAATAFYILKAHQFLGDTLYESDEETMS